jgi:hypothetical protein
MRNQLILVIGLTVCGCLPAEAQTIAKVIFLAQPRSGPMMLLSKPPPPKSPPRKVFPAINPPPKSLLRFTRISTATYDPERNLEDRLAITLDRTPFVTESTIPVAELWGGRLQLEGFDTTRTRDPQFAPLGVGQVTPPASRDLASVNRSVDYDGLSIRFEFGNSPTRRPAKIWHYLRWVVGKGT